MHHLTFTGLAAGVLYCGKSRQDMHRDGETSSHGMYTNLDNYDNVCPACAHVHTCYDEDCHVCYLVFAGYREAALARLRHPSMR